MAITPTDFEKIWSSNASTPAYTFDDADYLEGWDFVGNLPPTRAMWNAIQKRTDEKMKYVFDNFGAPLVANTVADMTLQNRVYVYTGSEVGYTAGDWYYYDTGTSAWVDGGVYNAVAVTTDTTLTQAGVPADAKATGERITRLNKNVFDMADDFTAQQTIVYNAGTAHSSTIDKLSVDIYAGDTYHFYCVHPMFIQVVLNYADGTTANLGSFSAGTVDADYTASKDIVAIGIYFGAQAEGGSLTFTLTYGIKFKLQKEFSNIDGRFANLNESVFDIATKIATKSISYVAGSSHSADNDRLSVNIPQGNAFYIKSDVLLPYLNYYVYYADGTNTSIGSFNNAVVDRSFVASKDIVEIGTFWSSPSTSGTFTYTVQYGLKGDLLNINNNLDHLGDRVTKTISYNAGTSHSSNIDRLQINIPQGQKYRLTAQGNVTNISPREIYSDNTETVLTTMSAPFDVEYTAVHDVVSFGFYWSSQTAGGDITFTVQYGIPNDVAKLQERTDEVVHSLDNAKHIAGGNGTPLTLVHISDIHAESSTLNRIVDKCKTFNYDDMICTGDIVAGTYGQITSWWNPNILTCIGNHDTASYDPQTGYNWTALSMAYRDAYYIAPFESNWNIMHTAGTSYYYKDYTTQKVRLVVIDDMLYNDNGAEATAQTTWLASVLSDAIANNLHVLIALHSPHGGAEAVDCSFSRYGQTTMPSYADCNTPQVVIDTVQTAKNNGLNFIGYLCGHTHQDNMWDAENNGEQLMYCITCAGIQYALWKNSDQDRSITEDAFNVVTIDTTHTLVKIIRGGGADMDDHMRTRKAICFNYSTGEVVGEVL